jgi:cation-transporting ATPase 13A3/4/5
LRFFYHPLEDKYLLISGWKDPSWKNAKSMRAGLNAEDRDSREQIFGKNAIDIQQKSLAQLLVDEVSTRSIHQLLVVLTRKGISPVLHISAR